ncbi:MAG TPA: DSD1 family PLP-dependent enzyme [Pirellulales bacterium]|nr:DSD1 family PLP-dependent enzyme [Pirellulales bacterium]
MSMTEPMPALAACAKDALDTPALCVDLDVMDANIQAVMAACRAHGVAWRPHSKGHKIPAIAQRELAAGAIGVTCAKLGEAEVMAAAGISDILIANMIVGPIKVARLVELRRIADPIVCVDHMDQVTPLSDAMTQAGLKLRTMIEVDIGLSRVGTLPGRATLALAGQIAESPGLELAGIMGYEGHLLTVSDAHEKASAIRAALGSLTETADAIRRAGLPCEIVSCGGTGSYLYAIEQPGITEIQAGGAIFMDAFYRKRCRIPDLQYALTVLTTVVSRPAPERAIIDAGRKSLSMELTMPLVAGRDDIRVKGLSAEHGTLELGPTARDLKIGDRLELIPGYADLTTVFHDELYGFRDGRLEVVWPIEARGKLR